MPKPSAKSAKSSAIHAVVGSDEAEIKRAAQRCAEELSGPDAGEFGRDIIDGMAENVDQAVTRIHQTIDSLLTMPFFGGDKLVWLKNANFMADTVMGRSESILEALAKLSEVLASGLSPGIKFLLSAIDIDKRRAFYKGLGKIAEVQVFDKADTSRAGWEDVAGEFAQAQARKRGATFEPEALEFFILLTGGDSRLIDNEIEKLDLYIGPERRTITTDDVQTMVPLSKAGVVFELGNAIAERDLNRSLKLIDQLITQGESAIGILLASIIPMVRCLVVVKDLMQRHRLSAPAKPFFFGATLNRLSADATEHLPRKKDGTINAFTLGIAATHARRYKAEELSGALDACLKANVQLVTSQLEPRVVLSELVAKLVGGV